MKFLNKILLAGCLAFATSCGLTDLEGNLTDPNTVGVQNLDINLLMNKVLSEYGYFSMAASRPGMELTRMTAMISGDAYERAHDFSGTDGNDLKNLIWTEGYNDIIVNTNLLIQAGTEKGFFRHSGVAKIIKGATLITLSDIFGDVPASEAGKAAEGIFNPKLDSGAEVYKQALALIDEGIADLGKATIATITRDIYYGGSVANWTAYANTVKLKAYMNLSLADASAKAKVEELLKANIIDTPAENFTFKYGTADIPSISKAFHYRNMYDPVAGSASGYLGNYFMYQAYNAKGVEDPRWRYYFYRQVGSIEQALLDDPESIPCLLSPKPSYFLPEHPWCAFEPGFFGRDHGNNDGTPPDSRAITCVGVYPFGGLADVNANNAKFQVVTKAGQGANGAGIEPIWMSFFTDFVKAEAYLRLGIGGDARAATLDGAKNSIEFVQGFGATKGQTVPVALRASTTDYLGVVGDLYDAPNADKLGVAMKEYYIALYGNGVEAYNLFRRTGKPGKIQPMRAAAPGNFIRSLLYPSQVIQLNSSATQKSNSAITKVFWDNNPDNFVY